MSDIVQQLRGSVPAMPGSGLPIAWPCIVRSELLLRAAAEIERLRADNERLIRLVLTLRLLSSGRASHE